MSLSKNTTEALLDLVRDRLSTIQVFDREDEREVVQLKRCLHELTAASTGNVIDLTALFSVEPRRGRPAKVEAFAIA